MTPTGATDAAEPICQNWVCKQDVERQNDPTQATCWL